MAKPLELELMYPCPSKATANVCWEEVDNTGCCCDVDNPRIITQGNDLKFDFSWSLTGPIWSMIPAGTPWHLEVRLENLGYQPDHPNLVGTATVLHPLTSGTVLFNTSTLVSNLQGDVVRPVVMLHLSVGPTMIICAFEDFETIHIQ
jgi:hypothetical protein